MRTLITIVAIAIIAIGGYFLFTNYQEPVTNPMPEPSTNDTVQVLPLEHAAGIVRWDETAIYFDPVGDSSLFAGMPAANIVLVTDIHGDHLSTSTLASVTGVNATLIVPQAVKDMLPAELAAKAKVLANGASIDERGFRITAIPMYNLPTAENKDRHTKGRGNGYLIEKNGTRVYIAGDTAGTPEMRAMTDIDIAFVPMNLPYTMSVEEAAEAVLAFKPRTVYPYHFRTPEGFSDVTVFKQLVNAGDPNINVILANWYPDNN